MFKRGCGVTESVGDVGRLGWVPAVVFGVCVEMMVEWSGRCCLPGFERNLRNIAIL